MSSISFWETSKSGKPCERLIALCSTANCDITAKMEVPVRGSLDFMVPGKFVISIEIITDKANVMIIDLLFLILHSDMNRLHQ
jgi:hypothetical protein